MACGISSEWPSAYGIAIGEQHRITIAIGLDANGEPTQHIGAIRMVGNTPKALGFALGGQHPPTGVQTLQRGVGLRVNPAHRRELKRHLRGLVNHQSFRGKAVVGRIECVVIDRDRLQ